MAFTLAQQKAMAIGPKFTGLISILGSLLIMRAVCIDTKNGEAGTYHRLLLGMSAYDILGSFAFVLTSWAVPKGTPGFWRPSGNMQTCTFQGFLDHMNSAGPIYNACLCVYYVLRSRYGWKEQRLRRLEPFLHGIVIVNTLLTGIAAIPMKLFNPARMLCWIAPYPLDCKDSFTYGADGNCIRGDNAWIYRLAFWFVQIWISIVVVMVSMLVIYCTVLGHERSVDRVQLEGCVIRKQSKRVASEASWYMAACYIVWLPISIRVLRTFLGGAAKGTFPLLFVTILTNSMQGFFNAIIFFRGRFLKHRREHPHVSKMEAMRQVILNQRKTVEETSLEKSATDQVFHNAQKNERNETVKSSSNCA